MVSISASGGQLLFAGRFAKSDSRRDRMGPQLLLTHHVGLILAAAVLFVCVGQSQGAPPKPAELEGLTEAYRPFEKSIAECTISVGNADQGHSEVVLPSSCPLPSDAKVLAYEQNREFVCVLGEFSTATPTPERSLGTFLAKRLKMRGKKKGETVSAETVKKEVRTIRAALTYAVR